MYGESVTDEDCESDLHPLHCFPSPDYFFGKDFSCPYPALFGEFLAFGQRFLLLTTKMFDLIIINTNDGMRCIRHKYSVNKRVRNRTSRSIDLASFARFLLHSFASVVGSFFSSTIAAFPLKRKLISDKRLRSSQRLILFKSYGVCCAWSKVAQSP